MCSLRQLVKEEINYAFQSGITANPAVGAQRYNCVFVRWFKTDASETQMKTWRGE